VHINPIALNWQLETLLLALAGMEICWFAPLFLVLSHRSWTLPPFAVGLMLWLVVWSMMRLARFLAERQISFPLYEIIVLGMVIISSLLVIRLYVHWTMAWDDWSWLAATGRALTHLIESFSDEVIVLGTMFFLWWRAISLSQREHDFQSVGYEFRRNVLLLTASTLLLSHLAGREVNLFIAPFFFFSLLAVALARVKDKSRVSGGIERPFGLRWLAILSAGNLLVLGLAWLLSPLYSVKGFRKLLTWLDPLFVWMGRVASWLLMKFLQLLGLFMEWVIALLRRWLGSGGLQFVKSPAFEFLLQVRREASGYAWPPAWVMALGRYLCPTLLIIAALLLIAIWLEHRQRGSRRLLEDERQPLWEAEADLRVGGLLRRKWEQLRALMVQMGRFGFHRRLYAAVSVRAIYANVIRLAERQGFPRPPARTPYEFLPTLARAFPGHEADLARVTEAYVRVHYGELPVTREELEALRACWDRLRQTSAPYRLDQERRL